MFFFKLGDQDFVTHSRHQLISVEIRKGETAENQAFRDRC